MRAEMALDAGKYECLQDIVTDLMHLANDRDEDFNAILGMASMHFDAETED